MVQQSRSVVRRVVLTCALVSSSAVAAPPVEAQGWGRPPVPRSGACFYQHADFRGDYFCVRAGEAMEQMPNGLNDELSSIRTFGAVEVEVYRNPWFGGRSSRFNMDASNLQVDGWNDTVSSLRVNWRGGYGGGSGYGGRPPADPDRIIRRAYEDVLNREPDTAGLREYRRRMIDDGWTEAQVREALRRSPEFRELNTMTRQKAEEIVARAYRSVLGRAPDPAAEGFVQRVLRDKWTEQDVARELRKSDEYRNRRPPGQ